MLKNMHRHEIQGKNRLYNRVLWIGRELNYAYLNHDLFIHNIKLLHQSLSALSGKPGIEHPQ